ncbi:PepSY-associated TM helix domain-containing protein [Spirosoma flavus]
MKKLVGKLHLWFGLSAGLIVFISSITGCMYVFEQELQGIIHRDQLFVEAQNRPLLRISQVYELVKRDVPKATIQRITRQHEPGGTYQVLLKDKRLISVNPYTGELLGTRNMKRDFFAVAREIHTSLMLGDTGKVIIGTSALIYLFMMLSGLILWWPQTKRMLRQKFTIKWEAKFPKINYDWHSVGGFYAILFLLITASTGLIWAFQWWENGLYAITGSPARDRPKPRSVYQANAKPTPIDKAYEHVASLEPNSTETLINFPTDSVGAIRVQLRYDESSFYRKYTNFYFDQFSGKVLYGKRYQDFSKGDVARGAAYDIHTGGWLGLPGKILAFFVSLFSATLPISGFLIWWNKRKMTRKQAKKVTRKPEREKVA